MIEHWRPAWATVDLDAIRHNASLLARMSRPAALCAVVKADGYGHGAPAVARAALEGGAGWLAVALVEEGVALRDAGIDAPVLLLSEAPTDALSAAVAHRLLPTAYSHGAIASLAKVVGDSGSAPVDVHVKVDTGMHRVGAEPGEIPSLLEAVSADGSLRLGSVWTHLAVADGDSEEDRAYTDAQLERFDATLADLASRGLRPPLTHTANSAGAIAFPTARRDLVRCGIALYGCAPTPALGDRIVELTGASLRPALSLRAQATAVRDLAAGERPSYGRARPLPVDSTVATVPLGYADGVPRRLFDVGGEVLVGGTRRPLAGVVTMDQIMIDCGPVGTAQVAVGDEVVLLGRQGDEEIGADEWAGLLGTISYEVLCDIGPRVPRVVLAERDGRSSRSGPAG
jgi:alanine racemase